MLKITLLDIIGPLIPFFVIYYLVKTAVKKGVKEALQEHNNLSAKNDEEFTKFVQESSNDSNIVDEKK